MKALLLNSGIGRRMGAFTQDRPKCMVEIGGGYTILSRQLTQLAQNGITDVVITTGPYAEELKQYVTGLRLPLSVQYAHNAAYAQTNYIVSMHGAAPLLQEDDILLLHGDLVLENSVLAALIRSPQSVMAVDSTLPLPEKDFKAKLDGGQIVAIGVGFFGADCVACQPAYHWRKKDFATWLSEIGAFVSRGETGVYAENAFNALHGALSLMPLEMGGRLCAEIDNADDLQSVGARFRQTLQPDSGNLDQPEKAVYQP